MELKELESFIAIVKSGSITAAAKSLNISQPALTKQLHLLENDLNTKLIIRGKRRISLTENGQILYKRAEELITLTQKIKDEIIHTDCNVIGNISISCSDVDGMSYLASAIYSLQNKFPQIKINILCSDRSNINYQLDNGLIDFALTTDPIDTNKYFSVRIPSLAFWGILLPANAILKDCVRLVDLYSHPLIVPNDFNLADYFHKSINKFNIVATYTQLAQAEVLVKRNVGIALCLSSEEHKSFSNDVKFLELTPKAEIGLNVIWRKNHNFTKPAELFLRELYHLCNYPISD